MRTAPIGLYFCRNEKSAFRIGCESGALTHGHTDAILASGYFAYMISGIIQEGEIRDVAMEGLSHIKRIDGNENCYNKIKQAILFYDNKIKTSEAMKEIGTGRTAEEAMALALFLALKFESDFEGAVMTASKYEGNRDSIGSICGNLLGAYLGDYEIPYKWIQKLELSELIIYGADKILERVENGVQSVTEIKLPEVEFA